MTITTTITTDGDLAAHVATLVGEHAHAAADGMLELRSRAVLAEQRAAEAEERANEEADAAEKLRAELADLRQDAKYYDEALQIAEEQRREIAATMAASGYQPGGVGLAEHVARIVAHLAHEQAKHAEAREQLAKASRDDHADRARDLLRVANVDPGDGNPWHVLASFIEDARTGVVQRDAQIRELTAARDGLIVQLKNKAGSDEAAIFEGYLKAIAAHLGHAGPYSGLPEAVRLELKRRGDALGIPAPAPTKADVLAALAVPADMQAKVDAAIADEAAPEASEGEVKVKRTRRSRCKDCGELMDEGHVCPDLEAAAGLVVEAAPAEPAGETYLGKALREIEGEEAAEAGPSWDEWNQAQAMLGEIANLAHRDRVTGWLYAKHDRMRWSPVEVTEALAVLGAGQAPAEVA